MSKTVLWTALFAAAMCLTSGCREKVAAIPPSAARSSVNAPKPEEETAANLIPPPIDVDAPVAVPVSSAPFDLSKLNETLKLFCQGQTRYPKDVNELIGPGFLTELPNIPPGKKLVLDKDKIEYRLENK